MGTLGHVCLVIYYLIVKKTCSHVCVIVVIEKKETFNPKISDSHRSKQMNSQYCNDQRQSYSRQIFNTGTFYISLKCIEGILC